MRRYLLAVAILALVAGSVGAYAVTTAQPALACENSNC
jgi:hypothetical protein